MFGIPLVPLVIVAAGLMDFVVVATIYFYLEHLRKKCSEVRRKWPQAPGKILSSRLSEKQGDEALLYSPDIRFEYTIEGRRYEGDRCTVFPKWSGSNRDPHQKFVARFPRGLDVTVWVNPADPADAVLTTDPPGPSFRLVMILLSIAGGVTLIIGILSAIFRPGFPS